jgi:hypothetical protein
VDLEKFSQVFEQVIYDFLMWVIFFPYTLIRVLLKPIAMTNEVTKELQRPSGEDRFNGLSPPLFLFLCVVGAWALSHPPTLVLAASAEKTLAGQVLSSPENLILFRVIIGCAYPLTGALIYEWLTPGGISHASFRQPLYQQAYVCGPYTLISGVASSYMSLSKIIWVQGLSFGIVSLITIWFVVTQMRYFKAFTKQPTLISLLLSIGTLLSGWTIALIAAFIVLQSAQTTGTPPIVPASP